MNLEDISFAGKRALVRVDFNVPLDEQYNITDDTRIVNALPTIKYILDDGGSVVLMSHLGRPQKKRKEDGTFDRERFSLRHLVGHLSQLLKREVSFSTDCGGPDSLERSRNLKAGDLLLIENTRFEEGEKSGDMDFAQRLSQLGDIYVNNAFGTAHRAHASTTVVAQYFDKDHRAFGKLMMNEIANASKALKSPNKPLVAIIGGAKVSDKIGLIQNIISNADDVCIGGGMAYTFIKAQGGEIGNSLCEEDKLDMALEILVKAKTLGCNIHLPIDSNCAAEFSPEASGELCSSDRIPSGKMGLDIGSQAIADFAEIVRKGKTIIWNGPMGVFEFNNFAQGTLAIAQAVADATNHGAYSLIGGGDSVSAIKKTGLSDQVSFISTGGGAMLEMLEGKTLPGIAAIQDDL